MSSDGESLLLAPKLNSIPACGMAEDSGHPNEPENNLQHPKTFRTNLQSNDAVLFNQRHAPAVMYPVVAPNLASSGLKEHNREENNISAMRMCNRTHLTQPALKLAQNGLIKISSSSMLGIDVNLYGFCKFHVCVSLRD